MINTSSEYKSKILSDRKFYLSANITLFDGTVLHSDGDTKINDSDILQGGMEFEDAVSDMTTFQIGAAIINKNVLRLSNYSGKFNPYDFTGATVIPFIGLQLSSSIETLKKGVFTVDEQTFQGSTLVLESLDNMHKFEKPFSEVSMSFPISAYNALTAICTYCGVQLATTSFTNSNFMIQARPDDTALTCLDMVSYIAQIAGCFARCNADGHLEIKWYDLTAFENSESALNGGAFTLTTQSSYQDGDTVDGGNLTDYTSGANIEGGSFFNSNKYHHLYQFKSNPTVAIDDVVITGINVTDTSETPNTASFGTSGYILSIDGNPLIQSQSDATTIANSIGANIVGMHFRPFSSSSLSDPSIEAGDATLVSVRFSQGFNTYQSFVTSLSFVANSSERIQCNAETPSKNSSTSYGVATKIVFDARKNTTQQLTAYDQTVKQLTDLISNGFGMFQTKVVDNSGGVIYYMHDKPLMNDSSIRWYLTSGGLIEQNKVSGVWTTVSGTDKQGNALFKVITAKGLIAEWIKSGKLSSIDGLSYFDLDNAELKSFKGAEGSYALVNDGKFTASTNMLPSPYFIRRIFSELDYDALTIRDNTGFEDVQGKYKYAKYGTDMIDFGIETVDSIGGITQDSDFLIANGRISNYSADPFEINSTSGIKFNGNAKVNNNDIWHKGNLKIAYGSVTITPTAANAPTGVAISYASAGFNSILAILVTPNTSAPGTVVTGVSYSNATATGATIYLTRANTTGTLISWLAIGV